MVTAKQALEKARQYSKRYGNIIISGAEKDDYYAFSTNLPDVNDITPDMPVIQVFKSTGNVQEMLWCEPYVDKQTRQWVDPLEGAIKIDLTAL